MRTESRISVAVVGFMIAGSLAFAQPQPRLKFEVASIKPDSPGLGNTGMVRLLAGGRLSADKAALRLFMQNAYELKPFQIVGGPDWINSEGYDIEARAETGASAAQMRLMMQTLLEDRFRLKAHRETREVPVYTLGVAKGGLKLPSPREGGCFIVDPNAPLAPPAPGRLTPCGRAVLAISMPTARMLGGNVSMTEMARVLSNLLGRTIIDNTGFTGTFDLHLEFAADEALAGLPGRGEPLAAGRPAPSSDTAGPSIFSAVQEQLGLKLESAKGPVEVLIIDHVEKPDAN